MRSSLFPLRAPFWPRPAARTASRAPSSRRERRRAATLRATRLDGWETLGLGLSGQEALEQRSMLAADLVLSFDDNIAAEVDKTFYSAGSQVVYKLTVENKGDATATGAVVSTTLSSKIDTGRVAWFASYSGGGSGNPGGGGGDVNTPVTLPAGGKVVFQISGTVKADATGDLVSTANVAVVAGASNSRSDVDRFVPRSIVVADGPGFSGSSRVQLVDPTTGTAITPSVSAFGPDLKTGVRAAVGDLDADGNAEVVVVPNYGTLARIAVFRQSVANDGKVTLVRDPRYDLTPFGPGYDRGLAVALADFDRDGRVDVAVAKAIGAGDVKIFRSTTSATEPLAPFASFTPFAGAQGGARLAAADFGTFSGKNVLDAGRGDGKAELAVASGAGVAPVVKVYSVASNAATVVRTVSPFTKSFHGGVDLAVGRVNADSIPELLVAQGTGGRSQVQVINGRADTRGSAAVIGRFAAFGDLASRSAPVMLAGVETAADGLVKAINVVQSSADGAAMRRLSPTGTRLGSVAAIAGSQGLASGLSAADTVTMTTASGLKITWLTTPTGTARPTDASTVNVDYSGYLAKDGTNFDSGRGVSFAVTGVVKGFSEALKLMKVGEAVRVEMPSALAYGAAGMPPKIPANADLIFNIRLNSIS